MPHDFLDLSLVGQEHHKYTLFLVLSKDLHTENMST